jgi:hypothetical protein
LIAALGSLRSSETVEFLERIYQNEPEKNINLVALSAAWALYNVTGKDYGPRSDLLKGCRFSDLAH